MKCMLIDDDVPTVQVLTDIIPWGEYGFSEVSRAHCVQDAQMLFAAGIPDLVICDIEMPRGSGIEMIQWIRERGYDCAFIFFTCHENFDFASTAISYNADSYLLKPLNQEKLEAAVLKAVGGLKWRRQLGEYQKFGMAWLKNKGLVESSFWTDILMASISPRRDLIQGEIYKRELSIKTEQGYVLLLVSVFLSEIDQRWNESTFRYAFANLSSEIILLRLHYDRVVSYQKNNRLYVAVVVDERNIDRKQLEERGKRLIQLMNEYLKCVGTCYISEPIHIEGLAQLKAKLERMDGSNIMFRGKVHWQNAVFSRERMERFDLDTPRYTSLFVEREKAQIVNRLKKDLEQLAAKNQLDAEMLHVIREDFLQIVYAILARNIVQAHQLFTDSLAQQLYLKSVHSIFDFMKWAHLITKRTIETIKETQRSEGVADKAKRYIHENYSKDLNREDVAASVFLTPDYLAKVFKQETGMTMKEYLNACRIAAAKLMLIDSRLSIGQIAMETGYENISYFSTVFKKLAGETPNAYRSRHRLVQKKG
ncbi:response regulator transcription factor [Paenibacillus xylanexedens]|uniref:response regulator transcription factor n=1 Tax=Paenibacillus xylanexedens TaxID=528191 RepID=UPI003D011E02